MGIIMSKRLPGSLLDRLFSLRVRPLVLVCALFVIISLGVMTINQANENNVRLENSVTDLRIARDQQYKEYKRLQSELEIVETDDYIIAKARQLHGYMMPGEKLFVIKNPEALYGETQEPIQMYVVEDTDLNE